MPAPRWLLAVIVLMGVGMLSVIPGVWGDGATPPALRLLLTAMIALVTALLLGVARVFASLSVRVDREALRFHFGPFGVTLRGADIASARVEPYSVGDYLGWGIRLSRRRPSSDRAYSVPFLRRGVGVETVDGKHYHVSSRDPERLVRAVNRLIPIAGAGA